jgi:hypothetical protein
MEIFQTDINVQYIYLSIWLEKIFYRIFLTAKILKMKKYCALTAPIEASEQMAQVPKEEQAKGMELWMQWAKNCGDKLVDLGSPLGGGQKLSPSGSANSDLNIAGYSVLQLKIMDDAKKLLQGIRIWDGMRHVQLRCMKQCLSPVCKIKLRLLQVRMIISFMNNSLFRKRNYAHFVSDNSQ